MHQDPLFLARNRIAKYSLQKAHQRIQQQKSQYQSLQPIQVESAFDQEVSKFFHFTNLSTQYGDTSSITKGKFSHSGEYFVTVGASGQGIVWNTQNYNTNSFCQPLTHLKESVKLCDASFHPKIGKIPPFAPNIITGSSDGQIFVWTFDKNISQQKCMKIKAHEDRVNRTQFHPDGFTFLSASYDLSWGLWDATKLKELCKQKGHSKEIHTLDIHKDGSLLFTGDLVGFGMLWDLRTGKGVYQIQVTNSILCSAFHPNGFELAIGGRNNMINIFDLRRKKQTKAIPAHTKLISDLQYNNSGHILISSSHDNFVKLWHGRDYSPVCNLEQTNKVTSVDIHGEKIASTMIDRKWTMWLNSKAELAIEGQEKEQDF